MKYKKIKDEIIFWGKRLNDKGLVTAFSGNISSKAEKNHLLVTAHDSYLGCLDYQDIVLIDYQGKIIKGDKSPTSEIVLHTAVHDKFQDAKVVVHSHSPFTTAFFHYYDKLEKFSFESDLYLKGLRVVPQNEINVKDVGPVLSALNSCQVVVLKNHGVVSIGKDFKSAFGLIELLEEQSKANFFLKQNK